MTVLPATAVIASLRAINFTTGGNVRIIIPNSNVWGSTVKNYAFNDTRRNDMVMGIGYGDDIGKAIDVLQRVMAADDRVRKDPAPIVAVTELADSSVNLVIRPWCKKEDYGALRWDLTRAFKERLAAVCRTAPGRPHWLANRR